MAHDVFISYASENKTVADALCAKMEAQHIRCWIAPRDLPPGMPYGAALVDAIQACRAFIVILSSDANRSPHVPREVEEAASRGIPVIPFRIENIEPSKNLHYFIKSIHWLDALTPPMEKHLDGLTAKMQILLDRSERDAPAPPNRPATQTRTKRTLRWQAALCLLAGILGLGLWFSREYLLPLGTTDRQPPEGKNTLANVTPAFFTQATQLDVMLKDLMTAKAPKLRRYVTLTHLWNDPSSAREWLAAWQNALVGQKLPFAEGTPSLFPVDDAKTIYAMDLPFEETRRFALLVGVTEYDSGELADLRYPDADVEQLAEVLVKKGFQKNDVIVLNTTRGKADATLLPTADAIDTHLSALLQRAGPTDLIIVALSGSGSQPKNKGARFFAYRAKPSTGTGVVSVESLVSRLGNSNVGLKMVIVDACRVDPSQHRGEKQGFAEGFELPVKPTNAGVIEYYSCAEGQRSWEPEALQHGMFCHYLILGLEGGARIGEDEEITWASLVAYVNREIKRSVHNMQRNQTPHLKGDTALNIPLVASPRIDSVPVAKARLKWNEILKQDPYALKYDLHQDVKVVELARKLQDLSDSPRPHVRADRFLVRVSPFSRILTGWRERPVRLATAAADLGLPDPSLLVAEIQRNNFLAGKKGLSPLTENGQISRAVWESGATSAFQEAARLLGLGTPSPDQ